MPLAAVLNRMNVMSLPLMKQRTIGASATTGPLTAVPPTASAIVEP
jgi:hypothetical protein